MRSILVNKTYKPLRCSKKSIQSLFAYLDTLDEYKIPTGELSIVFLSEKEICKMHGDFLDDPTPTDVITFPGDPELDFAGEICVSVEQAKKVAGSHNYTFSEELTLYLIHGWLHLAGLDDKNETSSAQMRLAEKNVMARLVKHNKIPTFETTK